MSKFYKNKVALFLVCALTLSSETSAMESGNRFVYCQNLGSVFLSASNREILEKMLSILGSYESLELSNLNPTEFGFFLDEESLSKLSAKAVYNCTNILKSLENGYKLRRNESLEFKNNSVNFGRFDDGYLFTLSDDGEHLYVKVWECGGLLYELTVDAM